MDIEDLTLYLYSSVIVYPELCKTRISLLSAVSTWSRLGCDFEDDPRGIVPIKALSDGAEDLVVLLL